MTEQISASAAIETVSGLSFGQPPWLWPAILLFALALLVLIWGYRRSGRFDSVRSIAFFMKILAIAIIGVCLLEPLWTTSMPKPGANVVVILADNSRGMTIVDTARGLEGSGNSRGQTQTKLLENPSQGWQKKLADGFDLRSYTFDSGLTRSIDLATDLNYKGQSSDLAEALKDLARRYRNQALAAVVILSDGVATDISGHFDSAGLPPIYTVPIGTENTGADLAISNINVVTTNFEDTPVTVNAEIQASGLSGRQALVRLTGAAGQLIEQQKIDITGSEQHSKLRFHLHPAHQGVAFYQLEVLDEKFSDTTQQTTPLVEATTANNRKTFVVDRGQGPYRILYVSGRPNWEYKFLRRAIESDEQVKMVGLIRIAKREPKFVFSGNAGDKSNPLFSAMKSGGEDATYDKPVLVRLNVVDKDELAEGFPITPEVLFAYHAVIIDDLEAGFFTRDQMELLQRYVSERGGGLMMLGGAESFDTGSYDHTPIGDALPVYTRTTQHGSPLGGVKLELTPEGLLQPWARLRDQADAEQQRLASLPGFDVLNYTNAIKPGASLLAIARTASGEQLPALIAQRYGRGRSLAFTIGDAWRAGLSMDPVKSEDLARFWRQTLRWLIADVPGRVTLSIDPASGAKLPTNFRMRVLDQAFKPVDNAEAVIEVTPPQGQPTKLSAEPTSDAAGEFQAAYLANAAGGYRITATAKSSDGQAIGSAEAGLVVDPDAKEFASIKPNRALLEQLSQQTRGKVLSPSDLDTFADHLLTKTAPIMEIKNTPLWHNGWILALIVALLIGEWTLRRIKGMA